MSFQAVRVKIIKAFVDLIEKNFFERAILKFYKEEFKTPCNTVIDVGANKGQSIDFFLKLNPDCEISALEPNPELFQLLTKKYSGNKKIKLYNVGISNHSGEKLFFENVFDYTSSFEDVNPDSEYLKRKAKILGVKPENIVSNKYQVNVITLNEFIRDNIPSASIDVLKIDTEGHEFYCLEGLFTGDAANRLQYIQIENHNDDMYKNRVPYDQIHALLNKNNFVEYKIVPHGFGNLDEVVYKRK